MHGWPLLVHYCDTCHYNTPVLYEPTVWTQEHDCSHCGISSPGADLAGSSPVEMNQGQHDELAQLFAQNMQLAQAAQQRIQQQSVEQRHMQEQAAIVEHVAQSEKQSSAEQAVHFISSHYTGTAHMRPDTTSEPSCSPPPPYLEATTTSTHSNMPEAMADVLRRHSIDPLALLPNQIDLFLHADDEQRMRLLELWRIAPPSYPLEEHLKLQSGNLWASTSVEREEELARARYEQNQEVSVSVQIPQEQQQQQPRVVVMEEGGLDTHIPQAPQPTTPISPIREHGETAWPPAARMRVHSISARGSRPPSRMTEESAEPYIVNGYTYDPASPLASPRGSADPVYAAAVGLWQAPSYARAMEEQQLFNGMEDQYGAYEQIRNHADWERVNEALARKRLGQQYVQQQEDCEMEL